MMTSLVESGERALRSHTSSFSFKVVIFSKEIACAFVNVL